MSEEMVVMGRGLDKLRQEAAAIVVTNPQEYETAAQFVVAIKKYKKDVEAKLNPGIASADEHHKFLVSERNKYTVPAQQLVDTVEGKCKAFSRQEKERAEAEQRRINEENARKAREEAEAKRKQAEAEAAEFREDRVAQINKELKAGRITKREAAKLLKEAGAYEEAQKQQAAAIAEDEANTPQRVEVKPNIPKVAGMVNRTNWKFEIVNATLIPRSFMKPDEGAIGAVVRSLKDKEKAEKMIPGIRAYAD